MKRFSLVASVIALSVAVITASVIVAQDSTSKPSDTSRSNVGKLDPKTAGANIRASQLIGMNIQNSAGESLGTVNDLVVDGNTGKVRYAAVTYGGFLGIGNKMFAVPFEAFKCRENPKNKDYHILVLDVTKKQMEGAMGFDEAHWPNFADQKFTSELYKRYGVEYR